MRWITPSFGSQRGTEAAVDNIPTGEILDGELPGFNPNNVKARS